MLLASRNNLSVLSEHKQGNGKGPFGLYPQQPSTKRAQNVELSAQGKIERIKKMFGKVEISVSSYDTAWVSMVPCRNYPNKPSFPDCLDWVLENQNPDGSWGLLLDPITHPFQVKDSLSSTLACLLTLQKWNVGKQLVKRGLDFIGSNSLAAYGKSSDQSCSPIGFEIVFPGMINFAKDLGLNLPLDPASVDAMLRKRDSEIKRAFRSGFEGKKCHLAYVAEGFDDSFDWKELMKKHQRSNGSLFNSPSTTAAALIHLQDDKCFDYLQSLLKIYVNAVPTIYPFDIYTHLCMVDTLESLGIDRYFRHEIQSVLDETYRCWLGRDEEIVLDVTCCAMAFRLLRINGYEVSSDALEEFKEQESFFNSVSIQFTNTNTVFELYKASQLTIFQKEPILDEIQNWTNSFLTRQLLDQSILDQRLSKEVECALKQGYGTLARVENRRNIELYDIENIRLLKTLYRCPSIDNRDILELSQQDFNKCQAIHREELKELERWFKESRLDNTKFIRELVSSNYFLMAPILFSPELSDARISWTKNGILIVILDDLFDVTASREEILQIVESVQKGDGNLATGFCSEQVEIVTSSIHNTINEIATKASLQQGRCIKHHLYKMMVDYVKSTMREFEWMINQSMPSMEEYVSNGSISIAAAQSLMTTVYFLGFDLSEEVVKSEEFSSLERHMGIIGRLLNDLQTVEKERARGEVNMFSFYQSHDEAIKEIKGIIESNRRELLRKVVQTKGSLVPKPCKDMFWKETMLHYYVYMDNDEFSSPRKMMDDTKAVLYDQLNHPQASQFNEE